MAASPCAFVFWEVVAVTEDKDSATAVAGSSSGRNAQPQLLLQRPLADVRQRSNSDGMSIWVLAAGGLLSLEGL